MSLVYKTRHFKRTVLVIAIIAGMWYLYVTKSSEGKTKEVRRDGALTLQDRMQEVLAAREWLAENSLRMGYPNGGGGGGGDPYSPNRLFNNQPPRTYYGAGEGFQKPAWSNLPFVGGSGDIDKYRHDARESGAFPDSGQNPGGVLPGQGEGGQYGGGWGGGAMTFRPNSINGKPYNSAGGNYYDSNNGNGYRPLNTNAYQNQILNSPFSNFPAENPNMNPQNPNMNPHNPNMNPQNPNMNPTNLNMIQQIPQNLSPNFPPNQIAKDNPSNPVPNQDIQKQDSNPKPVANPDLTASNKAHSGDDNPKAESPGKDMHEQDSETKEKGKPKAAAKSESPAKHSGKESSHSKSDHLPAPQEPQEKAANEETDNKPPLIPKSLVLSPQLKENGSPDSESHSPSSGKSESNRSSEMNKASPKKDPEPQAEHSQRNSAHNDTPEVSGEHHPAPNNKQVANPPHPAPNNAHPEVGKQQPPLNNGQSPGNSFQPSLSSAPLNKFQQSMNNVNKQSMNYPQPINNFQGNNNNLPPNFQNSPDNKNFQLPGLQNLLSPSNGQLSSDNSQQLSASIQLAAKPVTPEAASQNFVSRFLTRFFSSNKNQETAGDKAIHDRAGSPFSHLSGADDNPKLREELRRGMMNSAKMAGMREPGYGPGNTVFNTRSPDSPIPLSPQAQTGHPKFWAALGAVPQSPNSPARAETMGQGKVISHTQTSDQQKTKDRERSEVNDQSDDVGGDKSDSSSEDQLLPMMTRDKTRWREETCPASDHLHKATLTTPLGDVPLYVSDVGNNVTDSEQLNAEFGLQWNMHGVGTLFDRCLMTDHNVSLVDVGSGLGAVAFTAAILPTEVYAIEPIVGHVNSMCNTVRDWRYRHVHLVHNAVAEDRGKVFFRNGTDKSQATNSHVVDTRNKSKMDPNAPTAFAIKLDDLLRLYKITKAALRIDVEGFEGRVLAGANKFLNTVDIPCILMEWKYVHSLKEFGGNYVFEILSNHGFFPHDVNTLRPLKIFRMHEWPQEVLWAKLGSNPVKV